MDTGLIIFIVVATLVVLALVALVPRLRNTTGETLVSDTEDPNATDVPPVDHASTVPGSTVEEELSAQAAVDPVPAAPEETEEPPAPPARETVDAPRLGETAAGTLQPEPVARESTGARRVEGGRAHEPAPRTVEGGRAHEPAPRTVEGGRAHEPGPRKVEGGRAPEPE